jgi:hypothetical protein
MSKLVPKYVLIKGKADIEYGDILAPPFLLSSWSNQIHRFGASKIGSTVKVTACLLPLAILSDVHPWCAEGRIERPFVEKATSSLRRV